jgi:hypothetical protein
VNIGTKDAELLCDYFTIEKVVTPRREDSSQSIGDKIKAIDCEHPKPALLSSSTETVFGREWEKRLCVCFDCRETWNEYTTA